MWSLTKLDLCGNGIDDDGIAMLRACWPGDSGLEIGDQYPGDEMYQVPPGGFSDDEDGLIPMMYQVPPGGFTDDEGHEDEEEASDMGDGSSQESGQESEEEESGQESEEED